MHACYADAAVAGSADRRGLGSGNAPLVVLGAGLRQGFVRRAA
jgi:hypothetical protein